MQKKNMEKYHVQVQEKIQPWVTSLNIPEEQNASFLQGIQLACEHGMKKRSVIDYHSNPAFSIACAAAEAHGTAIQSSSEEMTKLQQTATCPICLDGLHEGPDLHDYQANWNYWHEHSLSLEQDTASWVEWQRHEPLVTHEVTGSGDAVTRHWLCRGCVYRHNAVSGQFTIQICPVCRHPLDIPGREAGSVAHLQEYASEDVQDSLQSESDDDDDESGDDGPLPGDSDSDIGDNAGNSVVRVHVAGYTVGDECMLAREVSAQNAARAAGGRIANVSILSVFTGNATYRPVEGSHVKWGLQFLIHATELLQHWERIDRRTYSFYTYPVPVHDWTHGSMFDHAVGAGRYILAPTRYYTADRSIVTPLSDFSPAGRHAAQIQAFKDELQLSSPAAVASVTVHAINAAYGNPHNNDIYARASIFFLLTIIPELFACELPPNYPAGIAQLLELKAQFSQVPPAFSTRVYVERALRLVDDFVEDYNRSVFVHRVVTFEDSDVPGGGKVQNHIAPRPWVVMQIIQMRQDRLVDSNGPYHNFNRCVSKPHRDREDKRRVMCG